MKNLTPIKDEKLVEEIEAITNRFKTSESDKYFLYIVIRNNKITDAFTTSSIADFKKLKKLLKNTKVTVFQYFKDLDELLTINRLERLVDIDFIITVKTLL